jgi:hypothetical protein
MWPLGSYPSRKSCWSLSLSKLCFASRDLQVTLFSAPSSIAFACWCCSAGVRPACTHCSVVVVLTTLFHELLTFLLRRCPQRFPCDRRQAYLCSIDLLYVFQVLCVQWFAKMMFFRFAVSACMSLFRLIQTQAVHSVHLVSAWTVVVRSLELPKQKGSKQSGLGTGLHACRRFLSSFSRASTETIPRNEPARTKSTPRKVPSMHTYPDWLVACVGRGRGHLLPMSKCMLYLSWV